MRMSAAETHISERAGAPVHPSKWVTVAQGSHAD